MRFGDYLKQYQPLVYETFKNSVANERIAHSYLLSGESGVPLLETATFLAKSLICDHPNPLADEECRSCLRIDHHTYSDFIVLDGQEGQIKKGDVQDIVGDFSKTPLESKGVMIYIINLVENMNLQAVNSLLKFLEEPPAKTYAFLTTENETQVLPTIVSRCEKLRMILVPKETVIEDSLKLGVKEEDAEILSNFYNSALLLKERSEEAEYLAMKTLWVDVLKILSADSRDIVFHFENVVIPALAGNKKKGTSSIQNTRFFLDMLSMAFKDAIAIEAKQPVALKTYDGLLQSFAGRLPHLGESLTEILKIRSILNTNINSSLALMHLILYITEDKQ